jgi:predicted O-methyltransferase YrrM
VNCNMKLNYHDNTFLEYEKIGSCVPEYGKTYSFEGSYIDSSHQYYSECPLLNNTLVTKQTTDSQIIPGWLRTEDALKLYEMAYFAKGDILELGTYHGLSTVIQAEAVMNAPCKKKIYTVEINPEFSNNAKKNLENLGFDSIVTCIANDAAAVLDEFLVSGNKFDFAFVDHSHTYQDVSIACSCLDKIINPGGFILFHDYNDSRNKKPESDYGVYLAVTQGLDSRCYRFCGVFGCTGLYQKIAD